jgi:hypothetical protein
LDFGNPDIGKGNGGKTGGEAEKAALESLLDWDNSR